ncbi:MAG: hypothetical protein MHPSP_003246, partial [Paramarteilia canceri]
NSEQEKYFEEKKMTFKNYTFRHKKAVSTLFKQFLPRKNLEYDYLENDLENQLKLNKIIQNDRNQKAVKKEELTFAEMPFQHSIFKNGENYHLKKIKKTTSSKDQSILNQLTSKDAPLQPSKLNM